MLCQQRGEAFPQGGMPIGRGNEITPVARSQLIIVDTIDQVLRRHYLMVLWNVNGSSNCKNLLDEGWRESNHPLNSSFPTLAHIVQLVIPCRSRKVCIKIGIAKTPTSRRQIPAKPYVS